MVENMLKKPLIAVLFLVTLAAVAIPAILYLTYPVKEEEVIGHVMEKTYGNITKELPRFVPGVIGYAMPIDREFRYRGTLVVREKELGFIVVDKHEHTPVVFLFEYRCFNDSVSMVLPRETILRNLNNKQTSLAGYFFRTPRGPVFVPTEIIFDGIRCYYSRR